MKSAGDLTGEGTERGLASWYGADFAGLPTASGEIFDPGRVSAAHRALPLGTVVDVTNEKNGRTVRVRINDRGPFIAGRIVDLSRAAAEEIGSVVDGVVPVTLTVVSLGSGRRTASARKGTADEAAATSWAVQAGAFASEENASRLKERLAERYPSALARAVRRVDAREVRPLRFARGGRGGPRHPRRPRTRRHRRPLSLTGAAGNRS